MKINYNDNLINKYEYDYDPLQPAKNLKNNKKWYIFNIILLHLLVISILVMQGIMFYYFLKVGNFVSKINDVNVSDVNDYINKTKVIVDYVCTNLINC